MKNEEKKIERERKKQEKKIKKARYKKSGEISEEHFIHHKVCEKKISHTLYGKECANLKSHSVRKLTLKKLMKQP